MTNPEQEPEKSYQADAYAPPTAPMLEPRPVVVPYEATLGQRIAGGLLITNAVIVFLELAIMPSEPTSKEPFSSPGQSILPAIIDVVIGVSLLSKSKKVLPWAIFRAALGLVLFVAVRAIQGDVFLAVMQVAVSGSLLLLLVGDASKPRIAFGSVLFSIYGLLSFVGIGAELTGTNPLAVLIQGASGQLEKGPARNVTGEKSHYQISAPSDKWRLRTREAADKENPLADRWLIRPDVDAHVVVIAEKAPGTMLSLNLLADAVLDHFKQSSTNFKLIDRQPMRSFPEDGLILHTQSTIHGMQLEYLVGVIGYYEHSYQIMAFTTEKNFPALEAEFRSIIESFKIPTDEAPTAPKDCHPEVVKEIRGSTIAYALTAPSDGWYLRTDEAAKKDNSLTDRWLIRPDKSANILVIVEEIPGAVVDIDKLADAVTSNIKTGLAGEVMSREPIKSREKNGRILRVKATVEATEFEYIYGLYADGPRAFQVVTFAPTSDFGKVQADLQKAIETFKLPSN